MGGSSERAFFGKAILEKDPPLAIIWLNRPDKRNALDIEEMFDLLIELMDAETDDDIKAIAVRGKGGNFCGGADLSQIAQYQNGSVTEEGKETVADLFSSETKDKLDKIGETYPSLDFLSRLIEGWLGKGSISTSLEYLLFVGNLFNMIERLGKKITIAAVEGQCVAGGFELMLAMDFAIATEDAKIGDFHVRHALMGGAGPLYRLPRYVGLRRAKELILSGRYIKPKEGKQMGLLNRVASPNELDTTLNEFVEELVHNIKPQDERIPVKSPIVQRIANLLLDRSFEADKDTLEILEALGGTAIFHTQDSREAVRAFLEKSKVEMEGK